MTPTPAPRPLSAVEAAVVEENAVALGVTVDALMEHAGRAVAEEASSRLGPPPARVALLAGPGNNGGDAMAAAHYLSQWGYETELWLVRPPSEIRSAPARRRWERVERAGLARSQVPRAGDLAGAAMVIDGLLGTGAAGSLRGAIGEAVAAARACGSPILSIDLPTGMLDPDGLRPRWTVALGSAKVGLGAENGGEIVVREIGLPPEAWSRTGPGEFRFLPARRVPDARGRSARVVVVGGGPYSGAPALSALAALRAGAERATVIAPSPAAEAIRAQDPNLIVHALGREEFRPENVEAIEAILRSAPPGAIALGMGAGRSEPTVAALRRLLERWAGRLPIVVDADGLAAVASLDPRAAPNPAPTVVATPNRGEFRRYFGAPDGASTAELAAKARSEAERRGIVLVVKGEPDLVSDGRDLFENGHHHPSATVGGAGDVLDGVLARLLAEGIAPLHAARLATYWVGDAGLRAAERFGDGLLATDVVRELPRARQAALARFARAP